MSDRSVQKLYNSEEVLASEDLYTIQEAVCSTCIGIKYQLTESELGWMDHIRGKYSIVDYVDRNTENGILTISDAHELSVALDHDCRGAGKAIMLADDTALQKIFFWCYDEEALDERETENNETD